MSLCKKLVLISGLGSIALFTLLLLTSCSNHGSKEPFQAQKQEEKYSQLEASDCEAEKKLQKNQDLLDKRNKEYKTLVQERDKLIQERGDYPRNTPDDIIKENKTLRLQLLKNDTTSSIGYNTLVDMLEDNRKLRAENWGLKKENQAARDHLEGQGTYLSNITGKPLDPTKSPLYLEKAEHKETRERLRLEKARREADKYYYEVQTIGYNQELATNIQEKNLYKTGYEQWRSYAKSLEGPKPNP